MTPEIIKKAAERFAKDNADYLEAIKIKWFKFTEKLPECKWIWLFNGGYVELGLAEDYDNDSIITHYTNWRWAPAEIEYPIPPEKEKHFCRNEQDNFGCYESYPPEKLLWIRVFQSGKGRMDFPVKFCPFCGFSLENY